MQQLQAAEPPEVTVSRTQDCTVLDRKSCKSRVRHEGSAHLRIQYVRLKDFPEPISRFNDRHVKALEPGVDDCAGFGTRQRLAYRSGVRRDAHEGRQIAWCGESLS
jgi:hypothetical protein